MVKESKMRILKLMTIMVIGLLLITNSFAQEEIKKTFDNKGEVRFKLVLGDCELKKSSNDKIHVTLVYTYSDEKYEPQLEEKSRYIQLREKFHGNNPKGSAKWTIEVPDDVEIDFKTATGDLFINKVNVEIDGNTGTGEIDIRDAKGQFDLSTGTGDIEVSNSEGEFDVNSGTGNVLIEDSKGNFDVSSGTGSVEVVNITIEDDGEFSCGTGDVDIVSPKGSGFELRVSSGTDDATLDMGSSPLEGYFEFTCHSRKGRISSPVDFDREDEYEEGDNKYLKKSFKKGSSSNKYYIRTGTGTAKLKK